MKCSKCGRKIDRNDKFCPMCGQKMAINGSVFHKKKKTIKKRIIVVITLLVCVCMVILIWEVLQKTEKSDSLSVFKSFFNQSDKQNVITYENSDTTYCPDSDHIAYDEKTGSIYFNNLLIVYTFTDLSSTEAEALADSVNGEIVGDISGAINAKQILVPESEFEELNEFVDILMESNDVLYAEIDYPIQMSENAMDNNPWSEEKDKPEKDRGNESKPKGNDWWAEAVGAYTAWKYSDKCNTITVNVGVVENGVDEDHIDLKGQISFLPDSTTNIERNHGTHVAGLIGAKNNSEGIRGIANRSHLICVDYEISSKEFLSLGEVIVLIKRLVENGCKVINNSWAEGILYSEAGYTQLINGESNPFEFFLEYFVVHATGTYDSYVKSAETYAKRTGFDCAIMMAELMLNSNNDFLIVQSAGNGYKDTQKGIDTKYSGAFCAIDEEVFNLFPDSKKKQLSLNGITYDSMDEHILIVGAVKNSRDAKGNYRMTEFSDFGENVDICAPGEKVFSTVCGNKYGNDTGTSMAAPIVSGSAALLWSLKSDLKASEVRELLLSSTEVQAVGVGKGENYKYPMLNVGNAVEILMIENSDQINEVPLDENSYTCGDGAVYRNGYVAVSTGDELAIFQKGEQVQKISGKVSYKMIATDSGLYYGNNENLVYYSYQERKETICVKNVVQPEPVGIIGTKIYFTEYSVDDWDKMQICEYDMTENKISILDLPGVCTHSNVQVCNSRIFYNEGVGDAVAYSLYEIDLQSETAVKVEEDVTDWQCDGNNLYFCSAENPGYFMNSTIHVMKFDLNNNEKQEVISGSYVQLGFIDKITDKYLYMCAQNYENGITSLNRVSLKDKQKITIDTEYNMHTLCEVNEGFYFSESDSDESYVCHYDENATEMVRIDSIAGNAQIVADGYVYSIMYDGTARKVVVSGLSEETNENSDTGSKEAMKNNGYHRIIQEYQEAINQGEEYLEDHPDEFPDINQWMVHQYQIFGGEFSYAYYDIDGNGTDEMLISLGDAGYHNICAVYALNRDIAQYVFDDSSIGDRSSLTIYTDGTMYIYSSGGAVSADGSFYRMKPDGYTVELIKRYDMDALSTSDILWVGENETLTSDEYEKIFDSMTEVNKESFIWNKFA